MTGVRDPEDPDRWLVAPWPADASFGDVVGHFDRAGTTQLHPDTSAACLLAFHEGLRAALAAAPTGEFTDQADWDRHGYMLNCADLGVTIFRDQYGRDPQADEDQHITANPHGGTDRREPPRPQTSASAQPQRTAFDEQGTMYAPTSLSMESGVYIADDCAMHYELSAEDTYLVFGDTTSN
jgi:hypothetical protein